MKTCILALQRYERLGDIDEWIKYHLNIKFDKIFILDNNDEENPLVYDDPCVEIIPYYGQRNDGTDWKWQREAYNYGFEYIRSNYRNEYEWISIIDIDEFIKLLTCSDIKEFIQKELIDKNNDSLALKWELYDDNSILYFDPSFEGHVQDTYKHSWEVNQSNNWNSPWEFKSMRLYTKFIGQFKDELYYDESAHHPANALYENGTYHWKICDGDIAVCKHYKYKCLEDFISKKCLLRNYATSVHGSTWKYARTYFEDNAISLNKLLAFAQLEYKYKLNMTEWDIEYLQQLFHKSLRIEYPIFFIWFGDFNSISNNKRNFILKCLDSVNKYASDFTMIKLNESSLHIDICPYVRFMYDHKQYGLCADFFKCLLLYYFGGIYMDLDVELIDYLMPYYKNNDYMLFDSSFYNRGAWFTKDHCIASSFMMSKPFNKLFLEFINYCSSFTYDQLQEMYDTKSKKDFMDYFYDIKIFYYHVMCKNNIKVNYVQDIHYPVIKLNELDTITLFDNRLVEPNKYHEYIDTFLIHHNIKTHEDTYFNN